MLCCPSWPLHALGGFPKRALQGASIPRNRLPCGARPRVTREPVLPRFCGWPVPGPVGESSHGGRGDSVRFPETGDLGAGVLTRSSKAEDCPGCRLPCAMLAVKAGGPTRQLPGPLTSA